MYNQKGVINLTTLKWRKIIIKETIQDQNGKHVLHKVCIALENTVTGYYLISPFTSFMDEFKGNKTTSASMAADVTVRFLNYIHFNICKQTCDITIEDGINYLNSLNVKKDTKNEYAAYMTKFYYYLVTNNALKYITVQDFDYIFDKAGRKVLKNLFTGRYIESKKQNPEVIHNIKKEYLYDFIKTAVDVTPDIAFGVFLQCFGGLRKSEVISLEYKNIGVRSIDGVKAMQLTLKDKDLREDIATAFIAKCKRNRIQTVFPAFGDMLWTLFDRHKANYKTTDCSAVFINQDGKAMTDTTYYQRFRKLKDAFIERLRNSDCYDTKQYAIYLSSFRWSTHICRGIFSNLIAESTDNIMEIATMRGDKNLSSALAYLTDREQTDKKVLKVFIELYKKENEQYGKTLFL